MTKLEELAAQYRAAIAEVNDARKECAKREDEFDRATERVSFAQQKEMEAHHALMAAVRGGA